MGTFRTRLSRWLLAASCALAPCTAWSQGAPLSDRDVALLDAFAALLNLEEGRPQHAPTRDPVRRTRTEETVSFHYVWPSPQYNSTKEEDRERAGSRYGRRLVVFKLVRPCIIRMEGTDDYSLGDSREVFGQHVDASVDVLDLTRHRSFQLNVGGASAGLLEVYGDKIRCTHDGATCGNAFVHPVMYNGRRDGPRSEAEAFWARKRQAVDLIKERCPARPG